MRGSFCGLVVWSVEVLRRGCTKRRGPIHPESRVFIARLEMQCAGLRFVQIEQTSAVVRTLVAWSHQDLRRGAL